VMHDGMPRARFKVKVKVTGPLNSKNCTFQTLSPPALTVGPGK